VRTRLIVHDGQPARHQWRPLPAVRDPLAGWLNKSTGGNGCERFPCELDDADVGIGGFAFCPATLPGSRAEPSRNASTRSAMRIISPVLHPGKNSCAMGERRNQAAVPQINRGWRTQVERKSHDSGPPETSGMPKPQSAQFRWNAVYCETR
jgi:hypothetical protein